MKKDIPRDLMLGMPLSPCPSLFQAPCKTNLSILDIPKKPDVTYKPDEPLGKIINSMFENKTRKILLENSYKYIDDRIIIEAISEKMKYLKDIDNFLDIPANTIAPEETRVIFSDLKINEVSAMMYDMEHPYVSYKDWIVTPWIFVMCYSQRKLPSIMPNSKSGIV
jgi:hypothetical protein